MNPSHPANITIRPLGPIGVIAAPSPGGPVGIGIGVPIMSSTSPMVPQIGVGQYQQKNITSNSCDDKEKLFSQFFAQNGNTPNPTSLSLLQTSGLPNTPITWTNQLLSSSAGMSYPVVGMGVIGPPHPQTQGMSDANILYGLVGTPANNVSSINTPSANSVINMPTQPTGGVGMIPMNLPADQGKPINVQSPDSSLVFPSNQNEGPPVIPTKEIIHCKSCTLFPPNPSAPLPTTRDKPNGCRTVFVGGLPENTTEQIVREIFEPCGEIATVRMSKKNFCHIRFEFEQSIESAIALSGYRIRIGSNSDPPNIGRLHVDYAQARDDLYEFECRQRQFVREQRHRERIEKERLIPPSPPPIALFSDNEASTVAEKIKSDDTFIKGVQVLIGWLERGDCVKRNSTTFYSMIQSTNAHVRRLLNEKNLYEEEIQKAKDLMRQRIAGLLIQISQIEKVLLSASHKKAWDHFSKAQRKNIEMWRKQATEIKTSLLEDALAERNDEEMDLSDSENEQEKITEPPTKKSKSNVDSPTVNHLQEENDSLRCQLQASNREVDMMKADLRSELETKDAQLKALQEALERRAVQTGLQRVAQSSATPGSSSGAVICKYSDKEQIDEQCDSSSSAHARATFEHNHVNAKDNQKNGASNFSSRISETEAKLIAIISTFLHVHPFGASLDYIWSYTQQMLPEVRANEIEALMNKFPTLFRLEITGIGATLERKWNFVGFQ